MKTELELAAKPKRKRFEAEVEKTKERAFERSYKQAAKEVAQAEGAAAGAAAASSGGQGASDPIVEAARQRALAPQQPVEGSPNPPVGRVQPKPSGEFIQRPDGSKVPVEYYDLDAESKARFDALLKEEESGEANESLALQYSKSVGDQQASDARRITALESQLSVALSAMEAMQRRMKAIDTSVEVAKSDALVEQESQAAQTVVNMASTTSDGNALIQRIERAKEDFNREVDARMASLEAPVAELEGRVKSSVVLMGERGNAVVDQLAAIESRVATAEVNQTEIDNGIKVNRDTLRAATGDDLKSVVDMNVKQAFDDRLDGAMDDLIQRKYVLLAPTNGTDGYDPKRDDLTKPFLAEQVGDNATERAVNRALKKAGRG